MGWKRWIRDRRKTPGPPSRHADDQASPRPEADAFCAWVQTHGFEYLDGELTPSEMQSIRLHSADCAACRRQLEACRRSEEALASARFAAPPLGDLRLDFYARLAASHTEQKRRSLRPAIPALAAGLLALALLRPAMDWHRRISLTSPPPTNVRGNAPLHGMSSEFALARLAPPAIPMGIIPPTARILPARRILTVAPTSRAYLMGSFVAHNVPQFLSNTMTFDSPESRAYLKKVSRLVAGNDSRRGVIDSISGMRGELAATAIPAQEIPAVRVAQRLAQDLDGSVAAPEGDALSMRVDFSDTDKVEAGRPMGQQRFGALLSDNVSALVQNDSAKSDGPNNRAPLSLGNAEAVELNIRDDVRGFAVSAHVSETKDAQYGETIHGVGGSCDSDDAPVSAEQPPLP